MARREMRLIKVEVDDVEKYQVVDKDNWVWNECGSARGAIEGVFTILGRTKSVLNKIDFFEFKEEVGFFKF